MKGQAAISCSYIINLHDYFGWIRSLNLTVADTVTGCNLWLLSFHNPNNTTAEFHFIIIGEYLRKIMKTGKCEKYYEFYSSKIKTLLSRTEWKISKSKIIEYNVNYLIYVVPKCINNSNIKKQVEKTIKNQFEGSGFRLSDIERRETQFSPTTPSCWMF